MPNDSGRKIGLYMADDGQIHPYLIDTGEYLDAVVDVSVDQPLHDVSTATIKVLVYRNDGRAVIAGPGWKESVLDREGNELDVTSRRPE
jgi:hypothetical protein